MKRLGYILIVLSLLIGCTPKVNRYENITNIIFTTGDNDYEIVKEKQQEILDCLKNTTIIDKKEVSEFDDFWKITLISESEEVIYLNEDGTFVKEENGKYYVNTMEDTTLIDIYKNALGGDIFLGAIWCSEEWIVDALENQKLFSININKVKNVKANVLVKNNYLFHQDKIEEIIRILNNTTTYPYIEYFGGLFGTNINRIYIEYENNKYSFSFANLGSDIPILILNIENNQLGKNIENCYAYLNTLELSNLYIEVFGTHSEEDISNYYVDANEDWVSKIDE